MSDLIGNMAQGAISSITYSSKGGFGWDANAYSQSVVGEQALSGYLGGMAQTATSSFLSGNLLGFGAQDAANVQAVSGLIGNGVDAGIQYGMTGSTTLNLLNFADLSGNQKWNTGLLQLTLGGAQGGTVSLGTGGIDTSVGSIANAIGGLGSFIEQQKIRLYNAEGKVSYAAGYKGIKDAGTAMREQYSLGDAKAKQQLADLLSGADRMTVGKVDGSTNAQTTMEDGVRTVNLATLGTQGDIASQLMAGIVLQHEAYRSGITQATYAGQLGETTAAVLGHTDMALRMEADPQYAKIMGEMIGSNYGHLGQDVNALTQAAGVGGISSFAGYVANNYDTSGEYWKVMEHKDGTVTMTADGTNDVTVYGPDGKQIGPIHKFSGPSITGFIAKTLGMSKSGVNTAMAHGGFTFSSTRNAMYLENGSGVVHFSAAQSNEMAAKLAAANGQVATVSPSTTSGSGGSGWLANAWNSATGAISNAATTLWDNTLGKVFSGKKQQVTVATPQQVDTKPIQANLQPYWQGGLPPGMIINPKTGNYLTQQLFEKTYGLPDQSSCATADATNIAADFAGGITGAALNAAMAENRQAQWILANGKLQDMGGFTGALLAQMGMSGYLTTVPSVTYTDPKQFFSQNTYRYAAGYFRKLPNYEHYLAYGPFGTNDPLGPMHSMDGYDLQYIHPIQWYP